MVNNSGNCGQQSRCEDYQPDERRRIIIKENGPNVATHSSDYYNDRDYDHNHDHGDYDHDCNVNAIGN